MQPYHVVDDARWAEGRIGRERCAGSYAYRSLLDAGATLINQGAIRADAHTFTISGNATSTFTNSPGATASAINSGTLTISGCTITIRQPTSDGCFTVAVA